TSFILSIALTSGILSCKPRTENNETQAVSDSTRSDSLPRISDDSLLTLVEYRTFQYFWDGAEPTSGAARERIHTDNVYPENDKHIVTSGGTGFGIMAILVGI